MAGQPYFKSGKTFRYQATVGDLVGRGAYGRVFNGHFKSNLKTSWEEGLSKKKQAAIKRVEIICIKDKSLDIENDREVVALKELRHPCIVTLYAVEDDDDFRNFIFELCQANLEEFITKKYNGDSMPDEIEGLYQMASGLRFIHEKKMIHRDIKPENVLISFDGQRVCLKIADLGLTKPLNEDGIHFDLASGLKGTEYYMAPELLVLMNLNGRVLDEKCTTASDVFAAGCTFFRYCAGGLHPFGNGFSIEGNIMNGNPVNLTEYNEERWKIDLIEKMVKFDPGKRPSFSEIVKRLAGESNPSFLHATVSDFQDYIGGESLPHVIVVKSSRPSESRTIGDNLQIDRGNRIGQGAYGFVFRGTFNGEKVAIKRVQQLDSDVENRELEINQKFSRLNHPNIVQFKHYEENRDFRFFVFELCAASIQDYILGRYQEPMMPTDEQVLFQLASGLEYIHSNGILHRNVTPANVLISLTKPVQMKYCDFGVSRFVNERGTCTLSGVIGTKNWISPEELKMWEQKKEILIQGSVKSDIFSAGCLFIYFLLRGQHPFGNETNEIARTIIDDNPVYEKELPEDHFSRPWVIQMIEHEPEKRISLSKVIEKLKPLQPSPKLSLLQYDHKNMLSSTGTFSLVYYIGTFEGSSLAVKRIPIEDCTTKPFDGLKQLAHLNIIRLLHFDKDDVFKYFGMELCVASLDQLFLPVGDPKKYSGQIPSNEEFCFQLISGLQYIHGKSLVHGSIKPTNILMSSRNDPQIKLSDFGWTTTSRLNEAHTTQRSIGGFLSSRYWLAPELLDYGQNEHTKESDIFSAGSVFFYFLSKGRHLFAGDEIHKIIANTSEGIHANIFCELLPKNVFPSGLIRWMTSKQPGDRPKMDQINRHLNLVKPLPSSENLRQIGGIYYSVDHFVEGGGQGNVFFGKWKDSQVAVKRIGNMDTLTPDKKKIVYRERENYQKLKHRNIVELFAFDENEYFMVLALEKCLTSVHDYCCIPQLYREIIPIPSEHEVLLQMAQGLDYIHSQDLIHRDVKPHNILISGDNPAVIKWADFGMTRAVITGSRTFSWSKLQGTDRWLAPELIEASQEKKIRGSQKCDIFALGCVFFFFVVPGIHPFGDGDEYSTKKNIKEQKQINFDRLPIEHFASDIIKGMIENNRESRYKLPDVVAELLKCTSSATDDAEKFLAPKRVYNDLVMKSPSPVKKPRNEND